MSFLKSFLNILGSFLGAAAAKSQEIQQYLPEYETMTDNELKKEYMDLKNEYGTEAGNRLTAVKIVLKSRGYGK